ncbi:hypothetical protein AaE_011457 [Aphanomyces astaci]|uniref:Dynein regulatory complex protein 12 n=1 Tax=Aphanomyces astaci TaxID=112090 RepID=A0A6A4ZE21_APHAT|nr:hypothetical protein AaE_011457 [Aphanomyces astaci]
MGPKKDKKKGKDKKGADESADNGGVLTPEDQVKMLGCVNRSLQLQLADRHEMAVKAMEAKKELQGRVTDLQKDFEMGKTQTFGITQDMTRQYKSMQEELLNRINALENTNTELRDQLGTYVHTFELARVHLEEVKREKDGVIGSKNSEIQELKAKMEEMAAEFGDMLKETLDRMRERIEISNTSYDNESGQPMMRRLEEFNLSGSPSISMQPVK